MNDLNALTYLGSIAKDASTSIWWSFTSFETHMPPPYYFQETYVSVRDSKQEKDKGNSGAS
eukprot:scaffold11325_cov56-Attheya_sp.AAC.2